MKLTTFFMLVCFVQLSAKGYSQTVTLSEQNISLEKVFKAIHKQTGYNFLCTREQLKNTTKIDVNVSNAPLEKVLSLCFENQPITYAIINKTIIVKRKVLVQLLQPPSDDVSIQGTVVDSASGKPLVGVTVQVKGTSVGATTDANGRFSLEAPDNAVLIVSYVGYSTKEINVGSQTNFHITLASSSTGLNQLVVVGYGTTKKKDLTGSIAQIKSKELESVPVYNIEEELKGRASGVRVMHNSGAPGSRVEVRIRGGNSMIGSNSPLYVVDGFPVTGGIDFLNPSDIESIDILKDASATAIYGARGANGVVIITTRRGRSGQKNTISVQSYYGIQQTEKRFKLLTPKQYAVVANTWMVNSGQQPYFNLDEVSDNRTDWQDIIFRDAPVENHTITFSGSAPKTNYSLSGNYYKQEGIIMNSGAQRGSFRINLDHNIKKWLDLAVNLNLSRREQYSVPVDNGERGTGVLSGALSAPPTVSPYDSSGLPTRIEQAYPFGSIDMRNPLIYKEPYKDRTLANTILQNTALDFTLARGLSFKTRLGLEYENYTHDYFSPIIYPNDRGSASSGNTYWNSFLNEDILNYKSQVGTDQKIDLTAGFTYQTYTNKYSSISVSGFSNNITEDYNLGVAQTVNPPSSGYSQWHLLSWLGRANYSIRDKYYITASFRADGSSRFGEDNKWGLFPSGALAWRISEEPFIKDISFISNLKLRTSYGITGNTALSPYQSLDRISSVKYIYENHNEVVGYVPAGIPNSKLKWETTSEFDLGFDLSVWASRLDFTFDYYHKNTNNLLASIPLPPSIGFGYTLQNIGEIENQGLEFSLSGDILTDGFKWNVQTQVSINRNKVLKLAGGSDIISSGRTTGLGGFNIAREGLPLGSFYGYIEDGLDENGYIKYLDVNKDGDISPADRVILGNPYPDFTFGFGSDFSYKNFGLNIFFQGVYGNDVFFETAYTSLNSFQRGQNQLEDLYGNYWTSDKPNSNAKYPKISSSTQMRASDRFIKNGSYLRCKTLQLYYILPMKHWALSNVEIYLKATNLFTLTNYPGLDPEVNTTGNDSQDISQRLQIGVDENGYPNAKIFAAGLQLNF